MGQVAFSGKRGVSWHMAVASAYLVSVSSLPSVFRYTRRGTPYDRRRSSQHPIEIHSMDHRASLTSLSHFLPITYITFPRKVTTLFLAIWIHCTLRPTYICISDRYSPPRPFSLSCRSAPSWFLCISLFFFSPLYLSYSPRFALAHISQFLPG